MNQSKIRKNQKTDKRNYKQTDNEQLYDQWTIKYVPIQNYINVAYNFLYTKFVSSLLNESTLF